MERTTWIKTAFTTFIALLLVGCMGKSRRETQCLGSSSTEGCGVSIPPSCIATPTLSSVSSGTNLEVRIAASGGTGPYQVTSPTGYPQSFSSNLSIFSNYTYSISSSTTVTRTATIIDSQGSMGNCSWTVTQVPNVSPTDLACSLEIDNANPNIGDYVNVTVRASTAVDEFGALTYDTATSKSLNLFSNTLAQTQVSYSSSGQKLLSARITKGTQTATCSNNLVVRTPNLRIFATPGNTASATSTIRVRAALENISTSGIVYQFESNDSNVALSWASDSSVNVSTLDWAAHTPRISVYASMGTKILAIGSVDLIFTAPTTPSSTSTTTTSTTLPNSPLNGCTLAKSANAINIRDNLNITVTPQGGSGSYYVYLFSDIQFTLLETPFARVPVGVHFTNHGLANLTALVQDRLSYRRVTCSTQVSISPPSYLLPGEAMFQDGVLVPAGSNVCNCRAIMQGDGNFVVYRGGTALWHTNTWGNPGAFFTFQGDRNLVVYSGGIAKWNSRTYNTSGSILHMQGDCNLVLYNTAGTAIWNSRTYQAGCY